jgi:hypothetical protein
MAVAAIMLLMTRQQFSDYINNYDQVMLNQWMPLISDYNAQYGSNGLQEYLESNSMGNGMGNGMGQGPGMHRRASTPMAMRLRQGQR